MRCFTVVLFYLLAGCQADQKMPLDTEFVLSQGMVITATNPNGTITISAGRGTQRTFSGDGWKKERNLIPRDTRWNGSFGLYDPAESSTMYGRLLVEEGRLFFQDESEALRYLFSESGASKPVFNNQGLVVGYNVESIPGGESTRSVEIWQIYLKGKRPIALRGATDSALTIKGGIIPDFAEPHAVAVGSEISLGDIEYHPEKPKGTSP
jgi:hypothetical protein